jgi:hypothetical protein
MAYNPSYYENTKYFNLDSRAMAIKRSWEAFKNKRPACAKLLEILFGDGAAAAHINVEGFSETRARMALEVMGSHTLRHSGDSFKITKM